MSDDARVHALNAMSHGEVWDLVVGNQSVHEFLDRGGNVEQYVDATCSEYDEQSRDVVKRKLAEHLYRGVV